jgi:hypothetical protein
VANANTDLLLGATDGEIVCGVDLWIAISAAIMHIISKKTGLVSITKVCVQENYD